jgi:hypothetical protein
MTMDHQNNPEAACVARARTLLDAVALGVERLESAAHQASCRLAALAEALARLEGLGGSRECAAGGAALDAATVCRQATVLLRYVSSRQWPAGERLETAVVGGARQPGPGATEPARTGPRGADLSAPRAAALPAGGSDCGGKEKPTFASDGGGAKQLAILAVLESLRKAGVTGVVDVRITMSAPLGRSRQLAPRLGPVWTRPSGARDGGPPRSR